MRDLLVTALVFGSIPLIFFRPWTGILVWSWLSYMNPHTLAWGFARTFPFAQLVAICLFVAVLFSKESKKIPINTTTVIWIIFLFWMTLTTILAIYPDRAFEYYMRVIKIQAVTFLTLMLITDKERVKALVWVIAMSIGFFSIKGGLFTIMTGGAYRVYGPGNSVIAENNALAVATLIIIPLMYYLSTITTNKWIRRFLILSIILSLISVLGSQSRGAFLAIAAVGGYFWWQSKTKLLSGLIILILAVLGFSFMPDSWHERMASIQNYEEDPSAMNRLNAWKFSVNLANDRFTGGGFNSWSQENYEKYSPGYLGVFVAHSIYFGVIADQGWIGFALFMLILGLSWRNLTVAQKQILQRPEHEDLLVLARMLKVSLVAFLSGGTFLSLAYFDLPWHILALGVIMRIITSKDDAPAAQEPRQTAHRDWSKDQHRTFRMR